MAGYPIVKSALRRVQWTPAKCGWQEILVFLYGCVYYFVVLDCISIENVSRVSARTTRVRFVFDLFVNMGIISSFLGALWNLFSGSEDSSQRPPYQPPPPQGRPPQQPHKPHRPHKPQEQRPPQSYPPSTSPPKQQQQQHKPHSSRPSEYLHPVRP